MHGLAIENLKKRHKFLEFWFLFLTYPFVKNPKGEGGKGVLRFELGFHYLIFLRALFFTSKNLYGPGKIETQEGLSSLERKQCKSSFYSLLLIDCLFFMRWAFLDSYVLLWFDCLLSMRCAYLDSYFLWWAFLDSYYFCWISKKWGLYIK